MNHLMLSVGRRGELLKQFRQSMSPGSRLIATDMSPYAPALYFADAQYLVPRIDDPAYLDTILDICRKEDIQVVTTFIDPEIQLLARERPRFQALGVTVLAPDEATARLCFDKYEMFLFLREHQIPTAMTWGDLAEFEQAHQAGQARFPVFVKPRTGSGSVGARKVASMEETAGPCWSNWSGTWAWRAGSIFWATGRMWHRSTTALTASSTPPFGRDFRWP